MENIKTYLTDLLDNLDALYLYQKEKQQEAEIILGKIAELGADEENKDVLALVDDHRFASSHNLLLIEDMKLKITEIVTIYKMSKSLDLQLDLGEELSKRFDSFQPSSRLFFVFRKGKIVPKEPDFLEKLKAKVKTTISGDKKLFLSNFKKSPFYESHTSKELDKAV